ncbi:MAG: thrombospondin type 3 repeat-containing protein, partial [Deltaproteobacteria bacterium]|nr:thrombospondin type 3 repeat-containing protein [Deltaproteobacteria bacterium]
MVRLASLVALAACGRLGFDASPLVTEDAAADATNAAHDEDGDGIPDTSDTCPHLPAVQTDGDGDGVGDVCDPNPSTPGDTIALFATMAPGDQPFTTGGGDLSAVFTQKSDALRFDGELGADNNLYGNLQFPMVLGNVRVALGIDVLAVIPGSASTQSQIALAALDQAPNYFAEVNQIENLLDNAAVSFFDGANYTVADARDLATGIHPG